MNDQEHDFVSNSISFSLENKPNILSVSPSFYWELGTAGVLTVTGSNFDTSKQLYLKIKHADDRLELVITSTAVTNSTSATFDILSSYFVIEDNYTLTISHYEVFPIDPSNHTIIVVSTPKVVEAYPLSVPADTPSSEPIMKLTLHGTNFTQYTI